MTAPRPELTMYELLTAIVEHRTRAREYLMSIGVHPKVIYRKAELADRKGLIEYGVVVDRGWLTDKGRAWLAEHGPNEGVGL